METGADRKPTRLARSDWIGAALEVIAVKGIGSVSVERLADGLGVTKGSFYWHFESRGELVRAALEDWSIRRTEERIRQLALISDPYERLEQLVGGAGGTIDPMDVYLAAAPPDATVRSALLSHHRLWLDFAERLFQEAGDSEDAAALRALLAYSSYLGLVVLHGFDSALIKPLSGPAAAEAIVAALLPACAGCPTSRPNPTTR